ncbi:MAG: hypothetical protein K2H85_08785, partial [Allobaculum sp.]|nr:hypothetical protein [Allobaculum sp.]
HVMIFFPTRVEVPLEPESALSFLEKSGLKSPTLPESPFSLLALKPEKDLYLSYSLPKVNPKNASFESQVSVYEKMDNSMVAGKIFEPRQESLESSKEDLVNIEVQPVLLEESSNPIGEPVAIEEEIWSISYIPWQGADSAPLDGSIGLWADGWFIAHRHTPNGQKIASFVPKIEVDGQLYIMDDTWISSDEITLEEIVRIRANHGLTLQTCIDDVTNYMVHYRPAPGFSGYSYCFSQYPYTVHDTLALGYDPLQASLKPDEVEIMAEDPTLEPDLSLDFSKPKEEDIPSQDFIWSLPAEDLEEPFFILEENLQESDFSFV